MRQVGDARHPRQKAFVDGIARVAVLEILLLLRERRWSVRDLVALDDAVARWNAEARAVILNVPRRRIDDLPDALQVRLPFTRFRWRVCAGGLCRDARGDKIDHGERRECD